MHTTQNVVITIHGIRTFGEWQERLETLIVNHAPETDVYHYKYGLFSSLAFLAPPIRHLYVRRFSKYLESIALRHPEARVCVVAHSFGTHLAVRGIQRLARKRKIVIDTLILSGSVLPTTFDWQGLHPAVVRRVVNECGANDLILVLNQLLALGMGVAGRVGFKTMTSRAFRNRFYQIGHSGYFAADGILMRDRWLPILLSQDAVIDPGTQRAASMSDVVIEWIVLKASPLKILLYVVPPIAALVYVNGLRLKEIGARHESDIGRAIAEAALMREGKVGDSLRLLASLDADRDDVRYALMKSLSVEPNLSSVSAAHVGNVSVVRVSPNAELAVTGDVSGGLAISNVSTGRILRQFSDLFDVGVADVQFATQSGSIVAVSDSGDLAWIDAHSLDITHCLDREAYVAGMGMNSTGFGVVPQMILTHDAVTLVFADGFTYALDIVNGVLLSRGRFRVHGELEPHTVMVGHIAPLADRRHCVVCYARSWDGPRPMDRNSGQIGIVDVLAGSIVNVDSVPADVTCLSIDDVNGLCAMGRSDGKVDLMAVNESDVFRLRTIPIDGKAISVSCRDGWVAIGTEVKLGQTDVQADLSVESPRVGIRSRISAAARGAAQVRWFTSDPEWSDPIHVLSHQGPVTAIDLSNGNKGRVVCGVASGATTMSTGRVPLMESHVPIPLGGESRCIACSDAGDMVIVGSKAGDIAIWEYWNSQWHLVSIDRYEAAEIVQIVINASGTRFALRYATNVVLEVDVDTGSVIVPIVEDGDRVTAMCWLNDAELAVCGIAGEMDKWGRPSSFMAIASRAGQLRARQSLGGEVFRFLHSRESGSMIVGVSSWGGCHIFDIGEGAGSDAIRLRSVTPAPEFDSPSLTSMGGDSLIVVGHHCQYWQFNGRGVKPSGTSGDRALCARYGEMGKALWMSRFTTIVERTPVGVDRFVASRVGYWIEDMAAPSDRPGVAVLARGGLAWKYISTAGDDLRAEARMITGE